MFIRFFHELVRKLLVCQFLITLGDKTDIISKKRGLHVTIDGTHPNNVGAQIVADIFYKIITGEMKNEI